MAQATGVPKDTVSKRLQRLADAGVVTRYRIPGNRKEVHLRPTPVGKEIQAAHRSLHEQMGTVFDDFLTRYSPDELEVLSRVLNDLLRMPHEGLRFRPDPLDQALFLGGCGLGGPADRRPETDHLPTPDTDGVHAGPEAGSMVASMWYLRRWIWPEPWGHTPTGRGGRGHPCGGSLR